MSSGSEHALRIYELVVQPVNDAAEYSAEQRWCGPRPCYSLASQANAFAGILWHLVCAVTSDHLATTLVNVRTGQQILLRGIRRENCFIQMTLFQCKCIHIFVIEG